MNTAIIIDYSIEWSKQTGESSQINEVVNNTLNTIGRCRIKEYSNSIISVNGVLTDEEKDYIQSIGKEINVEYVFLEFAEDYYGENRTDTYTIKQLKMNIQTKFIISDAILFYVTAIIIVVSILSIDYLWECGLFAFFADIMFCALLIYACKIAIPTSTYRIILGYNLWLKLLYGNNKPKEN